MARGVETSAALRRAKSARASCAPGGRMTDPTGLLLQLFPQAGTHSVPAVVAFAAMQTKPRRRRGTPGPASAAQPRRASHAASSASDDPATWTLQHAAQQLRRRAVSPLELTRSCLARIERCNAALGAFITVTRESALASARRMQSEQRRGQWRGPLHGVPIALKDNIDTAGIRTTGASELFKDRVPAEDAEVVRRLKNAGMILLGKLNLHEFAYGGTSAVTYFGAVHNPWTLDHHAGRILGRSGVRPLAADMCFGSLGTDTAGSVRIPGSYCGIVGFKPTYGRVSNRGVIPLSWSLDHTGPMTSVEDAAMLLDVIAGYDALDPTTSTRRCPTTRAHSGSAPGCASVFRAPTVLRQPRSGCRRRGRGRHPGTAHAHRQIDRHHAAADPLAARDCRTGGLRLPLRVDRKDPRALSTDDA